MQLPDSIVANSVGRGDIMHADIFKDIDHGKFFVVLSVVDEQVGYFYINSNINRRLQQQQCFLDLQFPLRPEDYPFLKYFSFLDATEIGRISMSELSKSLQNGHCQRVGSMPGKDMVLLLQAAQRSPLFTKKEKETFLKL